MNIKGNTEVEGFQAKDISSLLREIANWLDENINMRVWDIIIDTEITYGTFNARVIYNGKWEYRR